MAPGNAGRECRHSGIYLLGDNPHGNVTDSHRQWLKLGKKMELSYSLGLGGGRSRAATGSLNPVRACAPSQNGLLADCPQRQSEITLRPARPKAAPVGSRISKSPSMRMGPLLKTETLVGITGMVARGLRGQSAEQRPSLLRFGYGIPCNKAIL